MRDRGAADALGLVLIAPAVLGLALLIISLGRGVDATAQVRSAAESAAQAAALERNPAAAGAAAQRAADAMLADSSNCSDPSVVTAYQPPTESTSGVDVGLVRVTITCEVSNRGVEVINQPYDETVTAVATIDFFRARR
jgi:Flp pilus assembly protein TadG